MKNLSIVLNALLAIAVAVLYYFHFAAPRGSELPESTLDMAKVDSISSFMRIAYVNTDSLWDGYEIIAELEKDLQAERTKSEQRIISRTKTLETQGKEMMTTLQKKAQDFEAAGSSMSELIYNTKMRELQELEQNAREFQAGAQQEISNLQQTLTNQLLEKEAKGTEDINNRLKAYIKEYNKNKGFTYVLAYSSQAGGILLGDPALDITADIQAGLNALYKVEKDAKAAAAAKK